MTVTRSRLPGAQTKDIILRLSLETSRLLAMAAARENVDVEIIAERCIERYYSADGRTKSERQRAQATEAQEQLKHHHKSLGLSEAPDNEAEIVRLSRMISNGG